MDQRLHKWVREDNGIARPYFYEPDAKGNYRWVGYQRSIAYKPDSPATSKGMATFINAIALGYVATKSDL